MRDYLHSILWSNPVSSFFRVADQVGDSAKADVLPEVAADREPQPKYKFYMRLD